MPLVTGETVGNAPLTGMQPAASREPLGNKWTPAILIPVATAAVASGAQGYATSAPLPFPLLIRDLVVSANAIMPNSTCRFGLANGPVTSAIEADAAESFTLPLGAFGALTATRLVSLAVGSIPIWGLNRWIDQPNRTLWVEFNPNEGGAPTYLALYATIVFAPFSPPTEDTLLP